MTQNEHIYKIIRGRCISDASAEIATQDLIEFINGKCDCTPEESTGWISECKCNICGRDVKGVAKVINPSCKKGVAWTECTEEFDNCGECSNYINNRPLVSCGGVISDETGKIIVGW
jgi:hypothetical protein